VKQKPERDERTGDYQDVAAGSRGVRIA